MRGDSERYYHVIENLRAIKIHGMWCFAWDGVSQLKDDTDYTYYWHLQTTKGFQVLQKECLKVQYYDFLTRVKSDGKWVDLDDEIVEFIRSFYFKNKMKILIRT
jgi:hypothetical protein